MPLQSNLFAGDRELEACAVNNAAHITRGASGLPVKKIQAALAYLDSASIDQAETDSGRYGPGTAAAVLAYKQVRNIINRTYQTQPDNVVGIMTIAAMDRELNERETVPARTVAHSCGRPAVDGSQRIQIILPTRSRSTRSPAGWTSANRK